MGHYVTLGIGADVTVLNALYEIQKSQACVIVIH